MEDKKSYKQKITEEDLYWGQFEEEANRFGIPWWCDLRRATKLSKVICGWMHDPKIESILRGRCKNRLIKIASSIKGNALDIGCGAGWLSLELARNGMDVDGFEISSKRIEIAKEYFRNNPFKEGFGSINYQIEDINKIKLKKEKYQSVVSWDTLHHIPEIDRLVKEIYDSLRPNGYFVIYDHIGLRKRNLIFIRILQIPLGVLSKMKKLFKGKKVKKRMKYDFIELKEITGSPFEDITGDEMIDVVKKYFKIEILQTKLCFLARLANGVLNLPNILKYHFLHILKFIDDLLIKMHILRGEYAFIIAKKRIR